LIPLPLELFSDNAATTLTSSPSTGATSFTVASSTGFPAAVTGTSQFRVIIGTEIITVTNVAGTTWTCVATSAAHTSADVVTHVLTAASLGNFVDGKIAAQIGGAWTSTTAVIQTAGTAMTNFTATTRHTQVGKKVDANLIFSGATGFTAGTGAIRLTLPVAPYFLTNRRVGNWTYYDATNGYITAGWLQLVSSTQAEFHYTTAQNTAESVLTPASTPVAWAVNDELQAWLTYEAA